MKKKILNVGIVSLSLVLALSGISMAASIPVIGGKFERGVSAMCYYVDSSASAYTTYINTGINRWTHSGYSPTNFIKMTAVSSNKATEVDYYGLDPLELLVYSAIAETTFFSSSGMAGSGVVPYYYTEISINNTRFPRETSDDKIGTMAHEFGHALGLSENNSDPSRIMCQLGSGRTTNTVTVEEYAKVVEIYGGGN